ncbi:MAG: acyltransferase [Breznakibacter sp.]
MGNKAVKSTIFLDGIRGLAAFYVLIGHARWLLWEGYSEGYVLHPESYNIWEKFLVYLMSFFRYGHEAVLLFFVLSGFVIHLRYARNLRIDPNTSFDHWPFIKRRARRIIPPLLLAFFVTFSLDCLGIWLSFPIYGQNTPYPNINTNIISDHSFLTLLGNMSFVMGFYVPVFGTNGPLWSLAYEWWFYMLYPLLYYAIRRSFLVATIIVSFLYLLVNSLSFKPIIVIEIFSYLPIWWLGVVLAECYASRTQRTFKYLIPFGIILFIVPWKTINTNLHAFNQFLWGLGFMGVFAGLFYFQHKAKILRPFEILKPLGDISYSLYVIHMPIIVFISGILMQANESMLLPSHFGYMLLGCIVSLSMAYLAYWLAERPSLSRDK